MANTILQEISDSVTGDTDYYLQPGVMYNFQLNGTGVWEFDESGTAVVGSDTNWTEFAAGSAKNFIGSSATGHVRVNRGSGTCIVNVVRHSG
tara:strand:- start:171 stop:446 length:276 start_codon:yes stop_codon:yes gene_type:complete